MLGASPAEIQRLAFQGEVWRPMTESFLDRLGIGAGMRCLDVGAGIGMVSLPLAERVGPSGSVTAIEPAPLYAETLREQAARKDIGNLDVFEGDVRAFKPPKGRFDLVFSRWVVSFLPDVERVLARLVPALKRGGALAIEDYHHLGCAYYPSRPSFDAVIDAARRWYGKHGGNSRVAGELPAMFHRLGLKSIEVVPHVRVAGPDSDLWRWGELFFVGRLPDMVAEGLISVKLAGQFKRDLAAIKKTKGALFVVPTIFDVAGRRA